MSEQQPASPEPDRSGERTPRSESLPTHLVGTADAARARMVDVGGKAATARRAAARAVVRFPEGVLDGVLAGRGPKGAIEEVARIAGILAAKRTPELVPLCHGLALDLVDVEFRRLDDRRLEIRCHAATHGPTGVEMEAMVGAALASLCVYDMVKGLDKGVVVEELALLSKSGGKSGDWRAPGAEAGALTRRQGGTGGD